MINGNAAIQAISPKDLLVYLCLRKHANRITKESATPVTVLTKETGASPVTVLGCLRRLENAGHIRSIRKGRANCYSFLSKIEAKSYAFLDEDMTFLEKADAAVRAAFVRDAVTADSVPEIGSLYSYMVQLEETVTGLRHKVTALTEELNRVNRCLSVITGQPYKPLT